MPATRPDLIREADLIEELARLRGYDSLPTTLPLVKIAGKTDPRLLWERRLRSLVAGEGPTEVINLPLTSKQVTRPFPRLWSPTTAAVS